MMSQFIDRRLTSKNKNAVNRQRFLKRYKAHIKRAVSDAISKRSITDMDKGEKIKILDKDIAETEFSLGQGGELERILPGNVDFVPGDKIKRPKSTGKADGSNASNQGEGEDSFSF